MRLPERLRSLTLAVALVGTLLLGVSCGGGGYWSPYGRIEVHNSPFSFEFVDAIRVLESYGTDLYFFETFLLPGESLLIDDLYATYYDVTVYWSDGSRDTFVEVDVMPGWTTFLEVEN
jgi:hypothetical protein